MDPTPPLKNLKRKHAEMQENENDDSAPPSKLVKISQDEDDMIIQQAVGGPSKPTLPEANSSKEKGDMIIHQAVGGSSKPTPTKAKSSRDEGDVIIHQTEAVTSRPTPSKGTPGSRIQQNYVLSPKMPNRTASEAVRQLEQDNILMLQMLKATGLLPDFPDKFVYELACFYIIKVDVAKEKVAELYRRYRNDRRI